MFKFIKFYIFENIIFIKKHILLEADKMYTLNLNIILRHLYTCLKLVDDIHIKNINYNIAKIII